ncbi:MAG: hypothetical protein IPK26_20295 [Planctomycetes bacterium]|nr:hypothetical protein [Planctomycetota bacterium]
MRSVSILVILAMSPSEASGQEGRPERLTMSCIRRLPQATVEGEQLFLRDCTGQPHPVIGCEDSTLLLQVDAMRIRVDAEVIRGRALPDIARLLRKLRDGEPDAEEADLNLDFLLGAILVGDQVFADADNRWTNDQTLTAPDVRAQKHAIHAAATTLAANLPRDLSVPAQNSMSAMLHSVAALTDPAHDQADADIDIQFDVEFDSFLACDLIRLGWLEELLGKAAKPLTAAVRAAAEPLLVEAWTTAHGGRIETRRSALFHNVRYLRTATRHALAVDAATPQYASLQVPFPQCGWVIYDLPAEVDPWSDANWPAQIRSASLVDLDLSLAQWTPNGGLVTEATTWRRGVPLDKLPGLMAGHLPPHIALVDMHGDLFGIATSRGVLRPPASSTAAEAERFLRDAAELLQDRAELDLIGHYLVNYTADSPDPTRAQWPGTDALNGDLHQTAAETLGTVRGGRCTGDCDDLAELYVDILRRQARLGYMVTVPQHAAAMWVERDGDAFRAHVLHTGPGLECSAADATAAVRQAFALLDNSTLVGLDVIPVAERFGSDRLRWPTAVDTRAFVDAEHAARLRACNEAERHGLTSLALRLLDQFAEQDSPLVRQRRATLLATRGDFAAALVEQRHYAKCCEDADTRLAATLTELDFELSLARDDAAARERLGKLLASELPRQLRALGRNRLRRLVTLAEIGSTVTFRAQWPAAAQIATLLLPDAERLLDELQRRAAASTNESGGPGLVEALLTSVLTDEIRDADDDLLRQTLEDQITVLLECLDRKELAAWPERERALRCVRRWAAEQALVEVAEPTRRDLHLAMLGWLRQVTVGVEATVTAVRASPPPPGNEPLRQRPADDAALLSWLQVSPEFWGGELFRLLAPDQDSVDLVRWRLGAENLRRASADAVARGAVDRIGVILDALASVVDATLTGQRDAIAAALAAIRLRNDTMERAAVVRILAMTARFSAPATWQQLVTCWGEALGDADWLPFAWACLCERAPVHAVLLADAACARFPDDADVAAEAAAIRSQAQRQSPR